MVGEFTTMAREYLRQETIEPVKKLGAFAGKSIAAALLWSAALVLLSVAGLRALLDVLPTGAYWQALGYGIFVLVLVALCGILIGLVPDRGVHDAAGPALDEESA